MKDFVDLHQGDQLSTIEIINETENRLLSRRELDLSFRGASGLITRQSATEAIASKFGVAKDSVKLVSLRGKFGLRDIYGRAYIYTDTKAIERHLPNFLSIRQLPKEERKKAREQAKAKPGTPQESPKS